jgi:hypothetical protein
MPCDSSGYTPAGNDYEAHRQIKEMKAELDNVTSMLCSLLRQLDGHVPLSPEIADWFHKHREYDKTQGRL